MKKYQKQPNSKNHLKRKKNDFFVFDTYINIRDRIQINNVKGQSLIFIKEENQIILQFPSYIRKKSYNKEKNIIIDTFKIEVAFINDKLNEKNDCRIFKNKLKQVKKNIKLKEVNEKKIR